MDGRNASGRRISLLNDDAPSNTSTSYSRAEPSSSAYSKASLPRVSYPRSWSNSTNTSTLSSAVPSLSRTHSYFHPSHGSSSINSTPSLSPETPQLIRSNSSDSSGSSDSSDSSDSMDMDEPSPITPEFPAQEFVDRLDAVAPQMPMIYPSEQSTSYFHPVQAPKNVPAAYAMPQPFNVMNMPYAPQQPVPFVAPAIAPPSQPPQPLARQAPATVSIPFQQPSPPSSEQHQDPRSGQNQKSKKNCHPCPLAKDFNCYDYFTTSGHAARHAKKHTGEKTAVCPECSKKFTRKDNMEQHRKTHQNGRSTGRGASDKRKQQQPQQPSEAPLQSKRSKHNLPQQSVGKSIQLDASVTASPITDFVMSSAPMPSRPMPQQSFEWMPQPQSSYPDPAQFALNNMTVQIPMHNAHLDPSQQSPTGLLSLAEAATTQAPI